MMRTSGFEGIIITQAAYITLTAVDIMQCDDHDAHGIADMQWYAAGGKWQHHMKCSLFLYSVSGQQASIA
jgi:hypothetical protein